MDVARRAPLEAGENGGVLHTLVEMKNVSELMVDLAYTAVLLNDRPLARDVLELEARMNKLKLQLDQRIVESRAPPREAESLVAVLSVGQAMEDIADNARRVAQVVLAEAPKHEVLGLALEKSEQAIFKEELRRGGLAVGKKVAELHVPELAGMLMLAVKRKGEWHYLPSPELVLQSGDVLLVKGPAANKKLLERILR